MRFPDSNFVSQAEGKGSDDEKCGKREARSEIAFPDPIKFDVKRGAHGT